MKNPSLQNMCNNDAAMEILEEVDGGRMFANDVNKDSFGRKRNIESMFEMLSWVTAIAKNPCDPAVGSLPRKSKWMSYSNQEIWKQGQKMHPSMYDDHHLAITYNLRLRVKCDKRLLSGKSIFDEVSSDSSETHSSLDRCRTVQIPLGPTHQAEVSKWTGVTYESDSKWLGTKIWPSKTRIFQLLEKDPVGKGRQDLCGCHVEGSVECVQFHITEKRAKVKLELGVAFYQCNLHNAGEDVRRLWTQQEEKRFEDVVKSNPSSLGRCFWDHIFRTFPDKSRGNLVNYYFNVFLLQRRRYQNRHTKNKIDSDDDESEFVRPRNVFGRQTNKTCSFTLSLEKPQRKGR